MANESHHAGRAPAQIVVGLLVIAIGVLFLLDNLGFIPFRNAISFWPVVFIAGGISLMASDDERKPRALGAAFVMVGIVLLLQRMGFFFLSWQLVWPVLLILGGGRILYRSMTRGRQRALLDKDVGAADLLDVTAILGGVERRVSSPDFRGGDITALLGGCELDLRESSIVGEAVIDVFAVCGGINIKVPADWTVIMQGTPILGGFSQKTVAPPDGSKRLVIRGQAVMGGVEVHN